MKIIARKIYYEQNLYQYPNEQVNYGLFPLEKKNAPRRKDPELVHKKGDFKEWKFVTEEICCTSMESAIEAERITFQDPISFAHGNEDSEEKIQRVKRGIGVFITCACWPIQSMRMHYCHFCGKKIEIEEKK
ncbi:unnamed protein product [marine sediment metagenome]|uniref:Uncharacterized protein n=1 Tax=marine sediment metagenome TaxID=412755 RepID=X1F2I3_9ZZZZ